MKKKANKKLVVFDCDGTVLDTYHLIMMCTRKTFELVFPELVISDEEIDHFFGPLLQDSFRKYTKDEEKIKEAVNAYRNLIVELHPEYVRSFPGMTNLIKKLYKKDYILTMVSNKITETIVLGLEINRLDEYFGLILGVERLEKPKPDPDGLHKIAEFYQTNKLIFVGDTKIDIDTGHNVDKSKYTVKTVGVTWGNIRREEFIKWQADYIIDEPSELLRILEDFYER